MPAATASAFQFDPLAALHLHPDVIHPAAAACCTESFWFDPTDEASPFGSDQGSDLWLFYLEYRMAQPDGAALAFAEAWIAEAGYAQAMEDAAELSSRIDDIREAYPDFVAQWEAEHPDAGLDQLLHAFQPPDWSFAIREVYVCTALAQFMALGQVEAPLRELALQALEEELMPDVLARWGSQQSHRQLILQRLSSILLNASALPQLV